MNQALSEPQIYCVELHSIDYYNSGYLRFIEQKSNYNFIDGIFTCDYFRFDCRKLNNDICFILTIIEKKGKPKHYVMPQFSANGFKLESGINYEGICISDKNDFVFLTLLNPIQNDILVQKIIKEIDATQKAMTSP